MLFSPVPLMVTSIIPESDIAINLYRPDAGKLVAILAYPLQFHPMKLLPFLSVIVGQSKQNRVVTFYIMLYKT